MNRWALVLVTLGGGCGTGGPAPSSTEPTLVAPSDLATIDAFQLDGTGRLYACGSSAGGTSRVLRRYTMAQIGSAPQWDTSWAAPDGQYAAGVSGNLPGFIVCQPFAALTDGTVLFPTGTGVRRLDPEGVDLGPVDVGTLPARCDDGHLVAARSQGAPGSTLVDLYDVSGSSLTARTVLTVSLELGALAVADDETVYAKTTIYDGGLAHAGVVALGATGQELARLTSLDGTDLCSVDRVHASGDKLWVLDGNCGRMHEVGADLGDGGLVQPPAGTSFASGLSGGMATHPDGSVFALGESSGAPVFIRLR